MRKEIVAIGAAIVLLLFGGTAFSQNWRVDVSGGISHDNAFRNDVWDLGFSTALSGWFVPTDNLQFGIRLGYVRWTPDSDEFANLLPAGVTNVDITGSTDILEIVPSLRISTPVAESPIGLFGQFGAGIFIRWAEVDSEGELLGAPFSEQLIDDSENQFGFSLGLGISLGRLAGFGLEFLPLYNVLREDNGSRQYYTVNLGVSYEF
jgi:hypothetical protein